MLLLLFHSLAIAHTHAHTHTHTVTDCGPLSNIPNGTVITQGTLVGDNATYTCDAGNVLRGPDVRQCKTDGTWSSREPICHGRQ